MRTSLLLFTFMALLSGCVSTWRNANQVNLQKQVMQTERAFASTMAARDYTAFMSFISDEAVFFSGEQLLHGKQQVVDWWKQYFVADEAPFSWEPEQVAVLDSGNLALSTGPVYDANGKLIATFTSIWRQEVPGEWRIVFDKGNPINVEP